MKSLTLLIIFLLSGCGPTYAECETANKDFYYNIFGDSRCVEKGSKP